MRYLTLPFAALLLALAACVPSDTANNDTGSGTVACTLEAKLCPDGSYVGRVPPDCEFAACPGESTASSGSSAADQTVSDGTVTFPVLPSFALAVSDEQILKKSYIPPCDSGFTYCLYYNGTAYEGTNFESAGLGITKRPDLQDETACLNTLPAGYSALTPVTHQDDTYATSVFAPLGDAAAGHFAHDELYRLSTGTACYEFRTRIGQTQFGNYESGSIVRFTESDEAAVSALLQGQLNAITLENGTAIVFPQPQDAD